MSGRRNNANRVPIASPVSTASFVNSRVFPAGGMVEEEVGIRVPLPPPILEGGVGERSEIDTGDVSDNNTDENVVDDSHSPSLACLPPSYSPVVPASNPIATRNPASNPSSSNPHSSTAADYAQHRTAAAVANSTNGRDVALPAFPPMLSWPPRANSAARVRPDGAATITFSRRERIIARSTRESGAGEREEERTRDTGWERVRERREVPTISRYWSAQTANNDDTDFSPIIAFDQRRITQDTAHEARRYGQVQMRGGRRETHHGYDEDTDSIAASSEDTSISLSLSHSVAAPGDQNSEDYRSIFNFVNTAHDLGWSVENKSIAPQQQLQKTNTSDESRLISLRPPSALVAENNVYVMQQICTSFERRHSNSNRK